VRKPATAFLEGFYKGYLAATGNPPKAVRVTAELFQAYNDEVVTNYRAHRVPFDGEVCLCYRDMKVYSEPAGWGATVLEAA
jgi:hypothetical protein